MHLTEEQMKEKNPGQGQLGVAGVIVVVVLEVLILTICPTKQ